MTLWHNNSECIIVFNYKLFAVSTLFIFTCRFILPAAHECRLPRLTYQTAVSTRVDVIETAV